MAWSNISGPSGTWLNAGGTCRLTTSDGEYITTGGAYIVVDISMQAHFWGGITINSQSWSAVSGP